MFATIERSGLVEARHEVVAAAVDADGSVIATLGEDLSRPFFLRSALKPFQALASQRCGARLENETLAIACASHGGYPIHLAYVRALLADVGLDETALRCPADRPAGAADRMAAYRGDLDKRRIYHNCSGKHAGMLRACVASGWSTEYLPLQHPVQQMVLDIAADVTGGDVQPVGIDGCGVPTVRSTVTGLARAFSRLSVDTEFAPIRSAMARFAALTSSVDAGDVTLARWIPGVAKKGAEGCFGFAWYGGIGIAAKAWTGNYPAVTAAVLEMADRVGILSGYPRDMLIDRISVPVLGGGRRVGSFGLESV